MTSVPIPAAAIAEAKAWVPLSALIGQSVRLRRVGRHHVGLCPFHLEKTPSFCVYVDHYHCFGCGAHGDAIDWLRDRRSLSFRQALEHLGGRFDDAAAGSPADGRTRPEPAEGADTPAPDTSGAAIVAQGLHAWHAAVGPGPLVLAYLGSRALIPPPEPVIRSRPRIWWDVQRQHPEMLALVTDAETGEPIGCQITRLKPDGSGKAAVKRPRINLCRGGFVRLFPPGPLLAVAEGVETALAAAAIFGAPAWATLGAETLAKAPPVPPIVRTVLVAADNDWPGRDAARTAAAAYRERGLEVLERVPTNPGSDFNDVLIERTRGGDNE